MIRKSMVLLFLLMCPLAAAPVLAQEGHPVVGTWHGTWGPNATTRNDATFVITFTGKGQVISGVMNPGSNSAPITKASLDPATWGVHFEVDGKDNAGKPVHYVIDGKIENVGFVHRSIVGTLTAGTAKNDFKVTRD
jgi:hypothetical protein